MKSKRKGEGVVSRKIIAPEKDDAKFAELERLQALREWRAANGKPGSERNVQKEDLRSGPRTGANHRIGKKQEAPDREIIDVLHRAEIRGEARSYLTRIIELGEMRGSKDFERLAGLTASTEAMNAFCTIVEAAANASGRAVTRELVHGHLEMIVLAFQETRKLKSSALGGPIPGPKEAADAWRILAGKAEKLADGIEAAFWKGYDRGFVTDEDYAVQVRRLENKFRNMDQFLTGLHRAGRQAAHEYGYLSVGQPNMKDAEWHVFVTDLAARFKSRTCGTGPGVKRLGPRKKEIAPITSAIFGVHLTYKQVRDFLDR